MKLLKFFALAAVITLLQSCSDEAKVPEKVNSNFNQKFPSADNIKWDQENGEDWEAEFRMDGKDYSANYTVAGEWTETEYKVDKSEIKAIVLETLTKEYPEYTIKEAEISETKENSVYEFELEKGEDNIDVSISFDGKVLNVEIVSDEDKD